MRGWIRVTRWYPSVGNSDLKCPTWIRPDTIYAVTDEGNDDDEQSTQIMCADRTIACTDSPESIFKQLEEAL